MAKRRRSNTGEQPTPKKLRSKEGRDLLSDLSDELLIRIFHLLPIDTLLQCQCLSRRLYTLTGDSQLWKNLYYTRFVLPRALRIPGIKVAQPEQALHFSSRRSKWLDDNTLVNRVDGKKTNWKGQYKLRHNWSIGACEVQEIHVADQASVPSMLVRLAERVVVTADQKGLRAWDLKEKVLIAKYELGKGTVPSCLAVDEQDTGGLGIAVGFMDGGWGTWRLDVVEKTFIESYRHPASSNGRLSAIAYAHPYVLTVTDAQLLSLYTFAAQPSGPVTEAIPETELSTDCPQDPPQCIEGILSQSATPLLDELPVEDVLATKGEHKPRLLASLQSHTSWPPLSLSIRTTPTTLIASIAYTLPTYLSGFTIGLQELHLSLLTCTLTSSRLTTAIPQGFSSISPSSSPPSPSPNTTTGRESPSIRDKPTSLSYSHPYILVTHPDNTLTLYLCTSTATALKLTPGTKLWGHTSSVDAAEITARGKAVSVSTRGNELRVWELEGFSPSSLSRSVPRKRNRIPELSVRVRGQNRAASAKANSNKSSQADTEEDDLETDSRKRWVGFDDEVVIVLKESERGTQALMVYDFT